MVDCLAIRMKNNQNCSVLLCMTVVHNDTDSECGLWRCLEGLTVTGLASALGTAGCDYFSV